jgi:hypothetical protein
MKFLIVAVLCILVSCTDSKPEKSEEHSEEDKIQISPIIQQQSTVEEDQEPPFKPIFSKQYAKVFLLSYWSVSATMCDGFVFQP